MEGTPDHEYGLEQISTPQDLLQQRNNFPDPPRPYFKVCRVFIDFSLWLVISVNSPMEFWSKMACSCLKTCQLSGVLSISRDN